jgi:hypothetical protein
MTGGAGRVAAAFLALALLTLSIGASGRELRPYDAPRIDAEHITVPPLPLEYHTDEEAGIVLSYQPSTGERVRPLAAHIAAIRAELSTSLGREVLSRVEIRVAASPSEMARLAPMEQIPSYATAVAFSQARLLVMSASSPVSLDPPDLGTWLGHELAHLALDEALGGQPVPRWFHEGYAVHFSGEDAALRAEMLAVAALQRRILDLRDLERLFPAEPPQRSIAYAEAADFARFLAAPPNRERFIDMLTKIRSGEACQSGLSCQGSFEAAVAAAYGESFDQVELHFRKAMARRYSFVPVLSVATLLWVLVFAAVIIRRRRSRRALLVPSRIRGVETSRRAAIPGQLGRRSSVSDGAPRGRSTAASLSATGSVHVESGTGAPTVGARRARTGRGAAYEPVADDSVPPDPEVPKVEHDGRWYTLH